jgi:hypothetical protein
VVEGEPLRLPCFGAGEDTCPYKANAAEGLDLCEACEVDEMCAEEGDEDA